MDLQTIKIFRQLRSYFMWGVFCGAKNFKRVIITFYVDSKIDVIL